MVMLDFICTDTAELYGTGRERNIQNEKYVSSGIRTHATPPHNKRISRMTPSEEMSECIYEA